MTTMSDNEAVEVIQADREAAERFGSAWRMNAAGKFGLANLLARHRIASLEASGLNKAIEALEPFAREAEEWSDDVPNAVFPEIVAVDGSRGLARFKVGDLRRAATALAALRGQP